MQQSFRTVMVKLELKKIKFSSFKINLYHMW